jgi:N,N-dimethylformamidase
MMPLAGYADRLSVRPGETVAFKLANATGQPVSVRLVRVVGADANPAGPGIDLRPLDQVPVEVAAPGPQSAHQGSYGRVDLGSRGTGLSSLTMLATIKITGSPADGRAILSLLEPLAGGIGLSVDRRGRLAVAVGVPSPGGEGVSWRTIETPTPLERDVWHRVWVSFERKTGDVVIGSLKVDAGKAAGTARVTTARAAEALALGRAKFLIGAAGEGRDPFRFDGRIERPMIFDRVLSGDDVAKAFDGAMAPGLVGCWDFSREMSTSRIEDVGPHGLHGTVVNSPARAMRGSKWTGREHCFRHAPDQYGAIHFHSDDIDDCGWPTTHEWTVPADLRSGVYALLAEAGGQTENIPFFVVPPKGRATARIALLASTFTYTVYHNHTRPEWTTDPAWVKAWKDQAAAWPGAYPHNPGDHREYGLSTYNFHTDGSGIHFASWHRPMLNVRIGYITYPHPKIRGSGLRHFPADSHLTAWLEKKGFEYDLITDWELHHEGAELLKRYGVVMTGSHPEYHTERMLDALEAYRDGGGRLMYMGGNGFYWKIALSSERPGQIEIRRAEGGIRAWAAEPGEYYNQLDGEYGGLWRRNARPPQKLVGVGFTAQGNFVGSYYRVNGDARRDPRVAWILDGVSDEKVGDFGLSGHGAAGFELDRVDYRLGTPAHAVVVAASENHPPEAPWVLVPEEHLTHIVTWAGQPAKQLIRADMTFFETNGGGAVFSTGSITFCGSLPANGFENNISRITENVLRRFLDPAARFEVPAAT